MLLTGTFPRTIDEKFRLAIPKRLRMELESQGAKIVYLAPGTDCCLAIYTEEAFSRLAQRLNQVSPNREDVRTYTRLFFAQAQAVEIDAQGRVRIPPELIQFSHLGKEAVLVGAQDHLELWSKERWSSYLADKLPRYDEFAETAFRGQ